MFVDIVDSTQIAEQLGPEKFRTFLRATQARIATIISQHSGHIAQYSGDGTLVLFGFPTALDDHARYAVNAGLQLLERLTKRNPSELPPDRRLTLRISCHSGPLITDKNAIIEKGSMPPAEGAVIAIAARLQHEAAPNHLVISGECHKLTEGFFETRLLGDRQLKGIDNPVAVHEVVRPRRQPTLFTARQAAPGLPIVGRASEFYYLQEELHRAQTVRSRAVLITGEPGIGKSRLADELRQYINAKGLRHQVFQCEEFTRNTDFAPFTRSIRQEIEARSAPQATPRQVYQQDIKAFLEARGLASDDYATAALASATGFEVEMPPSIDLYAVEVKRRLSQLITSYLTDRESGPVCLFIEDVHWADPSTLELLGDLINPAADAGIFLVMTARSDSLGRLTLANRASILQLPPLNEQDAALVVARLDPLHSLSKADAKEIVARSGGVPLFIEECCKALALGDRQREAIPDRLRGIIWRRLDQLAEAKWVAQLAAVNGLTCSTDLLVEVGHRLGSVVHIDKIVSDAISVMRDADLIRKAAGRDEFAFRHALIRDAAYESLTMSVRAQWHEAYAEVYQYRRSKGLLNVPLEVVAQHFAGANQLIPASEMMAEAGNLAVSRFANKEAIALFTKAIQYVSRIEDRDVANDKELRIRGFLNAPLIAGSGWASSSLEGNNRTLLAIAQKASASRTTFEPLRMLFNVGLLRGDRLSTSTSLAGLESLRGTSDDLDMIIDRCSGAKSMYIDGDIPTATTLFHRSLSSFDPARHRVGMSLYDLDGEVAVRSSLAWLSSFEADMSGATTQALEVVEIARRIGHPFTLAYALCVGGSALFSAGEEGSVRVLADEALSLSEKYEMQYWRAYSDILRAAVRIVADPAAAARELEAAMLLYVGTGARLLVPWIETLRAKALLASDQRSEAEAVLENAKRQDVALFTNMAATLP